MKCASSFFCKKDFLPLYMGIFSFFRSLYVDGFKNMTWGKPLIWIILLKLILLFAILRVFFFKPAMQGLTDEEKSEQVGNRLIRQQNNPDTLTLNY